MKNSEVLEKLTDLDNKLNALGDLQARAGEAESLIQRIRDLANQIDQDKQATSQLKSEIQSISEEVTTLRQPIDEAVSIAKNYQSVIDENSKETQVFKAKLETFEKDSIDLEKTIKNQLGLVNAKILADSFEIEAKKLQESVNVWFDRLFKATFALFVIAIAIVFWEFKTSNVFWNANFLIKLTLTTPIIFFLIFIARQYSREKRLLDEYTFKSAVASSFEAYRKLVIEEGAKVEDKNKIIEFIISSVNNIYSSPMENMSKHIDKDEIDVDILSKVANIFKGFIK